MMNFNKKKHIIFSVTAGNLFTVWSCLFLSVISQVTLAVAGDRFVSPSGSGSACSPSNPCGLQTALNQSVNGDTIYLAGGTYTGSGDAVVTITRSITLYGGWDGTTATPPLREPDIHLTTLDGEDDRRGVYISGDITPLLQGLRITNGDATGLGGYVYYGTYDAGGGVYVDEATATLMDNHIFNNTASYGAGVYLGNSPGTLQHNTISSNTANISGGTGGAGGGVFAYQGAPMLSANTIVSNTADNNGGGLFLFSTKASVLNNTIFSNSTEANGGGIQVASCSPIIADNVIVGNAAAKFGGGIALWYSDSTLSNNVIADNQATSNGSGLAIYGSQPSLLHTTLARNTGGIGSGILVTDAGSTHSNVLMTNTIIAKHTVGLTVTADSSVTLEGTLWGNSSWANSTDWNGAGNVITGTINIWGNPAFVDPDSGNYGDYHLDSGSAARNAGVNAGVTTDIDGDTRPQESHYDIGADEFSKQGNLFLFMPAILTGKAEKR